MSGALWAVASGVGFGLFQTLNRRAVRDMDVLVSTFLQLLVSAAVLTGLVAAAGQTGRMLTMGTGALVEFSLAAFFHFFVGWTFFNASQKQVGAARTSLLVSTVPVFAAAAALLALGELPGAPALLGIALVVGGVTLVASGQAAGGGPSQGVASPRPALTGWRASSHGLATALCWAISPIFTRRGLEALPSPLIGLTAGTAVCVAAYAVVLLVRGGRGGPRAPLERGAISYKVVAGVLVALSTWARWIALDLAPVAVVLALLQGVVPIVVLLLSPLILDRHLEQVTPGLWLGATVIVGGSMVLIFLR